MESKQDMVGVFVDCDQFHADHFALLEPVLMVEKLLHLSVHVSFGGAFSTFQTKLCCSQDGHGGFVEVLWVSDECSAERLVALTKLKDAAVAVFFLDLAGQFELAAKVEDVWILEVLCQQPESGCAIRHAHFLHHVQSLGAVSWNRREKLRLAEERHFLVQGAGSANLRAVGARFRRRRLTCIRSSVAEQRASTARGRAEITQDL